MYEYCAKVVSVYDGDTITVDIDLGFGIVFIVCYLKSIKRLVILSFLFNHINNTAPSNTLFSR